MPKGRAEPNWKKYIAEWKSSGESAVAWCKAKNIPINTFYTWVKRLKKTENQLKSQPVACSEFIELKDQSQICTSDIILEYEGFKIHLHANFDSTILRQCLDCLRGVSC